MNKLLYHMMNAGMVDHRCLPGVVKAQQGLYIPPVHSSDMPSGNRLRDEYERQMQARANAQAMAEAYRRPELSAAPAKRSMVSKAIAIAKHPMTALAYKVKGQDIPDHFERGATNPLDYAVNVFNPASYEEGVDNFGNSLKEMAVHPSFAGLANMAVNSAQALPYLSLVKQLPGALVNEFGRFNQRYPELKNFIDNVGEKVGLKEPLHFEHMPLEDYETDFHYREEPPVPTKNWDDKLRFDQINQNEKFEMDHPNGMKISVNRKYYPEHEGGHGLYEIKDNNGSFHFSVMNKPDTYPMISDFSFFNHNPESSTKQLNFALNHISPQVQIPKTGSTSIYSQPLMNTLFARYANQPGRISLDPIGVKQLNFASMPGGVDYITQLENQFPKLVKSYNTLSNTTGIPLPEPKLMWAGEPVDLSYLRSKEVNDVIKDDPGVLNHFLNVMVPDYSIKKHWKTGGPILDPRGQWAHPGKVTRIPSSQITMQGVPYPVYGKANNGMNVMMYPGQDYHFPGADYVDEYPVMQYGGPSKNKAREILHDGTANGHPLTDKQRRFFGWIASHK